MSSTEDSASSDRQPTPEEVGVRSQPKPCGGCTVCCKVLGIGEAGKEPGILCSLALPRGGCGVHTRRPQNCADYQCLWTWAEPLDASWRPDVAGFLLNQRPDPAELEVVVDPDRPDAWRLEPYHSQIRQWADPRNGSITRVLVRTRGQVKVVFPDAEIDLGLPNHPGFQVQSGFQFGESGMRPFARFTPWPGQGG